LTFATLERTVFDKCNIASDSHRGDIMNQQDQNTQHGQPDKVTVIVDKHHHTLSPIPHTGADLRTAVSVLADRDLYQESPSGDDTLFETTSSLHLKDGDRFFTAPRNITPGRV
jgi:hypothetical protein